MKTKKYKSFILSVTVNINPSFPDVLYIVEYSTGKNRYIFNCDMSFEFSQRIHNFINSGIITSLSKMETCYKYGLQNVIN